MEILVQVKSAGKRRPILELRPVQVPDGISTLRELISAIVEGEVAAYNGKEVDPALCRALTEEEISDGQAVGRVSFRRVFSDKKADPVKAVGAALLAFEDGLFRVVRGEEELTEADTPLALHEEDILTFIRLTFLSGRLW